MIEIIDNAIQLVVLAGCCIYSAVLSIKIKGRYGFAHMFLWSFALGLIHWLLFMVFYSGIRNFLLYLI